MISRPHLGKTRGELSWVRLPGKSTGDLHIEGLLERGHGWSGDPRAKARSKTGQREELGCDIIISKVSANPSGNAEAGTDCRVISQ